MTSLHSVLRGFRNDESELRFDVLRWAIVACQAVTLVYTQALWQTRDEPPLLPASWYPFGAFDVFWPLLGSLVLALAVPRAGVVAHALLLLVAFAMDQTRMQPQVISCAILLWATISGPNRLAVGVAHLCALWFFAGLHKLLSPWYYEHATIVRWVLSSMFYGEQEIAKAFYLTVTIGVAVLEVVLVGLIVVRRTRRLACVAAIAMHLMILSALVGQSYNAAVWSWNVAVGVASFAFFWKLKSGVRDVWRGASVLARVVVVLILVTPFGYYLEWTDAYLSHCLYSRNKASAYLITPHRPGSLSGPTTPLSQRVSGVLGTSVPPEHRLFEAYFQKSPKTRPGDLLYIRDFRRGAAARGRERRLLQLDANRRLVELEAPSAKQERMR